MNTATRVKKCLTVIGAVGFAFVVLPHAAWSSDIVFDDGSSHEYAASGEHVDRLSLSNGSQMTLTSGDLYVDAPSSAAVFSGASMLTVASTARLFVTNKATSAQSFWVKGTSKIVVDGGRVRAPTLGVNGVNGATYIGGAVDVLNGGQFVVDAAGVGGNAACCISSGSLLVDNGSLFSLTNSSHQYFALAIGGSGSRIAVTNSTITYYRCWFGGNSQGQLSCSGAQFLVHNSTAKALIGQGDDSNRPLVFYSSKYNCNDNLFRVTGSMSSVNLSFSTTGGNTQGNIVELNDGSMTGYVRLTGGQNNKYVQNSGTHTSINAVMIGGKTNALEVLGGTFGSSNGNGNLTFQAGANGCRAVFADCTAYFEVYQSSAPLTFGAGAKDCSFTVQNATVSLKGCTALGNCCTNCVIAFKGATPKITLGNWGTVSSGYYSMSLGSSSSELDGYTVALEFTLPAEPYASAPLYGNASRPVKLHPNTRIVVKQGDWTIGKDKKKTFYPLIYDRNSFDGEMTQELAASLNAHATLPEGFVLEYDDSAKTLGLRAPHKSPGMTLFVR